MNTNTVRHEGICHCCGNRLYKYMPENDPGSLKWCSKACRKRGQKKKQSLFDVSCPHPYKKVYRTKEEAQAFIEVNHATDRRIHAYKCMCGAIHIGH